MRKRFKGFKFFFVFYFILFVLSFTSLFVFEINVKADSNIVLTDGAQIRTTGKEGIRFIANATDLEGYSEFGFVCAKGTYSLEEMSNAFESASKSESGWTIMQQNPNGFNYESASANSVNMIRTYQTNLDSDSKEITLTVYGIDSNNYLTDLSVFAYGKVGEEVILSDIAVSRNIAEIALQSNVGGDSSILIDSITEYAKTNYKKVGYDLDGNLIINGFNKFTKEDISRVKEMFINDVNEFFSEDEEFTTITMDSSYKTFVASLAPTTSATLDVTNVNIWKFFNDEKMQSKWSWIAEYLHEKGSTHVKNQARELLEDGIIASSGVTVDGVTLKNLYGCEHVASAIYLLLTQTAQTYTAIGNWLDMDFTASSKYDLVAKYCDFIYFDNIELVKVNDYLSLPEGLSNSDSKLWNGWFDGNNTYNSSDVLVVPNEDLTIAAQWTDTIVVDDDWIGNTKYDIVNVKNEDYIYGVTAFSSIKDSMDAVLEGMIVEVIAGTYTDAFTISKDNISIVGPNIGVDPNGDSSRNEEAIINAKIKLGLKLNNVTFNGLKFINTAEIETIITTTNTAAGRLYYDGFNFLYNYVDKGANNSNFLDFTFANFSSGDIYYYKDIIIDSCYFTAPSVTASFIYVLGNENLTVTNSCFNNLGGNAIYLDDSNTGTAMRGSLLIKNNEFIDVKKSIFWSNHTNIAAATSTIEISKNIFDSCSTGSYACIDFEVGSTASKQTSFNIYQNTFNNVYKCLYINKLEYVTFTNNLIYKYEGSETNGYIVKANSSTYAVDCNKNLYLSADGNTVYTTPSSQLSGLLLNTVNGDTNNYESLDAYKEAIASLE